MEQRKCMKGGVWSGRALHCELPTCNDPPKDVSKGTWTCQVDSSKAPRNATEMTLPMSYLTRCDLHCHSDFSAHRRFGRVCTADGWSSVSDNGGEPSCHMEGCGSAPLVKHGHVTCNAEKCHVECSHGYTLVSKGTDHRADGGNSTTILCDMESRSWELRDVTCRANTCGAPPAAVATAVSSVACALPITHTTATTTSAVVEEEGPAQVYDVVGTVCAYVCSRDRVYTLECNSSRVWEVADRYPPCAARCGKPPEVMGGSVSCGVDSTECVLTCDPGHLLEGPSMTRCFGLGTFSNPLGVCVPVTCPAPSPPDSHTRVLCSEGLSFGHTCDFACQDGYHMDGTSRVRCVANGTWSREGTEPVCRVATCQTAMVEDPNTIVTCLSEGFVEVCESSCAEGFALSAESAELRHCQGDGQWSGKDPLCEQITCKKLTSPPNGNMVCDGHRHGSLCNLECGNGTSVVGEGTVRCGYGGVWTGGKTARCA